VRIAFPSLPTVACNLRRRLTVAGAASELRRQQRAPISRFSEASDRNDRRASAPERGGSITSIARTQTMNSARVRDELRSRRARGTVFVRERRGECDMTTDLTWGDFTYEASEIAEAGMQLLHQFGIGLAFLIRFA